MALHSFIVRRLTTSLHQKPQVWQGFSTASRTQTTKAAAAAAVSLSQNSRHQEWAQNDDKTIVSFLAVAAGGLGLISSVSSCNAEAAERKPTKQAIPIDWNAFINTIPNDDDDEEKNKKEECDDEEVKEDCGCAGKREDDVPDYISEAARIDLGNSLNHHAPLGVEARNILKNESQYPLLRAELTSAPNVPPPCNRSYPVHLVVDLMSINKKMRVQGSRTYEFWPFAFLDQKENKVKIGVPGPFIRARVGDILQVNHTNKDESGMAHSIDFHAVCGPGGGSPTTFAEQDETRTGAYRLMKPGLFVYHCASAPIPMHIHNGMFGMILVEPEEGLPPVEKEFYVMQHELYLVPEDNDPKAKEFEHDYDAARREDASHVVFNGRENSLVDKPLIVNQDEHVRIFFGNAGPNLISSFHIIGTIFDKVYREGDLVSHPAKNIQTTLVPAGGACAVELKMQVPGNFALVDHSINRIDKGAVGFMKVKGKPRPDIYDSADPVRSCPGCKTHN